MASFPGSVKAFATKNTGDVVQAVDVNDLQDEVNAIEDGYVNGTAHLNSSNSTLANLSVTGNCTVAGTMQVLQLGVTNNFSSSNSTIVNLSISNGCTVTGNLNAGASTLASLHVTGGSTFASTTPLRIDGAVGSSGSTGLSLGRPTSTALGGTLGSTAQVGWLRIVSGTGPNSTYWIPLFR